MTIDLLDLQYGPSQLTQVAITTSAQPPNNPATSTPVAAAPTPPPPTAPQSSATQQFWAAVKSETAKGESQKSAIGAVVRSNPDLYARYLDEVNAKTPAPPKQQPATAAYMQLVAAQITATGCSRGEAMQHVNRTYPEARQGYVDEVNHR